MKVSPRSPLALLAVTGFGVAVLAVAVPGFGDELHQSTSRVQMRYYELAVARPEAPCIVALGGRTATVPVTVTNHGEADRVELTGTADGIRTPASTLTVADGASATAELTVPLRTRGETPVRIGIDRTGQSVTVSCARGTR